MRDGMVEIIIDELIKCNIIGDESTTLLLNTFCLVTTNVGNYIFSL